MVVIRTFHRSGDNSVIDIFDHHLDALRTLAHQHLEAGRRVTGTADIRVTMGVARNPGVLIGHFQAELVGVHQRPGDDLRLIEVDSLTLTHLLVRGLPHSVGPNLKLFAGVHPVDVNLDLRTGGNTYVETH